MILSSSGGVQLSRAVQRRPAVCLTAWSANDVRYTVTTIIAAGRRHHEIFQRSSFRLSR